MFNASRAVLAAFFAAIAVLLTPAGAVAQGSDSDADSCSTASAAQLDDSVLPAFEHTVVCLINVERGDRGLKPLRIQDDLESAGRRMAADMVERRFFAHITPGGWNVVTRLRRAGYPLSSSRAWTVGEVLYWGSSWRATPRETVKAWMHSPPHKAALLQPDFDQIGAGAALGNPVNPDYAGVTVSVEMGHVG